MAPQTMGVKLPKSSDGPARPFEMSAGEWGEHVESLGYESVWTSESWGTEAFVDLTEIACSTTDLRVGTAIANVFSRTPAVLAMASTTLARVSDGRMILGLGASHPEIVEALHGIEYHRPIRRTHDTITLLNQFMTGEGPIEYDGELLESHGYDPIGTKVPIYNAALGEANRRLTGRLADGWLPYLLPFSRLDDAFDTISDAAIDADRNPDDITITPQVLAAVSPDEDEALEPIKQYIASYIGHYDAYNNIIAQTFPEESARVRDAWKSGDEQTAIAEVTDEMVFELGVAGDAETARNQLRDLLDSTNIDRPIVYVPDVADRELTTRTIEALSPDRL